MTNNFKYNIISIGGKDMTYIEKLKKTYEGTKEDFYKIIREQCPGEYLDNAPLYDGDIEKCKEIPTFCGECWNQEYKEAEEEKLKEPEPNQAAKSDAGKPRLSLVPMQIIWDIAEIREYGIKKYKDPDNWKRVELDRYVDALLRHTLAFVEDHDSVDKESGLAHYKHMACNMAFICAMMGGKENEPD